MTSKICPSCNEQASDDAKFCARCGTALSDTMRDVEIALDQDRNICPGCGVPYLQDAKFCRNCGNKFEIRLPQPEKSFVQLGAAYVEDAELVRVGQNMGSTATVTCTKPRFSLPAGQVIQLTHLQTAQQTAYERTTLFNNSTNGATIVTPTAAAT